MDREKDLKLELQRQLDEERKKIEESVLKQAVEEHHLKDLEKEKKISEDDKKRTLDELEKVTHAEIKKLEDLSATKEKEIME